MGAGLMGVLLLLATLPPFVDLPLRVLVMHAFAPVCHQIAERSFHVDGTALAVCHRCYGIYWGLFVGPVAYLWVCRWEARLWAHSKLLVALSLIPLGMDWAVGALGVWDNTPLSRVVTGGIFGLMAGLFVALALSSPTSEPKAQRAPGVAATGNQFAGHEP